MAETTSQPPPEEAAVETKAEEQFEWGRDRKAAIADCDLDPASLIGSYFHMLDAGEIVWQGLVVGEVRAGAYLVHIDKMEAGAENVQILVPLDRMLDMDVGDWRFFDTEEEARAAFANWTHGRKDTV